VLLNLFDLLVAQRLSSLRVIPFALDLLGFRIARSAVLLG
jgi:hypothetical protein